MVGVDDVSCRYRWRRSSKWGGSQPSLTIIGGGGGGGGGDGGAFRNAKAELRATHPVETVQVLRLIRARFVVLLHKLPPQL